MTDKASKEALAEGWQHMAQESLYDDDAPLPAIVHAVLALAAEVAALRQTIADKP